MSLCSYYNLSLLEWINFSHFLSSSQSLTWEWIITIFLFFFLFLISFLSLVFFQLADGSCAFQPVEETLVICCNELVRVGRLRNMGAPVLQRSEVRILCSRRCWGPGRLSASEIQGKMLRGETQSVIECSLPVVPFLLWSASLLS